MKCFISAILICFQLIAFSQGDPVELTPKMEQTFRQQIEKDVVKLRTKLKASSETDLGIEFIIDTFRVESFYRKCMHQDYSTVGMNGAAFRAAHDYDSLLNKYYKKLLTTLQGDDKKVLIKAQKAWIAFRDSEYELVGTISKEQYAGGGTMQSLVESGAYLDFVRRRTIEIVEHLRRAIADYN